MLGWRGALHSRRGKQGLLWQQLSWIQQRKFFGNGEAPKARSDATSSVGTPRNRLVASRSSSDGAREELLWRQFFLNHTLWWDNRQHNKESGSPHFRHKESSHVLWLKSLHKPPWVDRQLAALDKRSGRGANSSKLRLLGIPGPRSRAGYGIGETLITLCQRGELREAVEALEDLEQTGSRIPRSLLSAVLRRCGMQKDLGLGRRIHVLVKTGYKTDTFLCNHIMRMYASHGRLQEVMAVFTEVDEPDAFMWSSIISAHVQHGQAKQAVRLYRRMRRSDVNPDGHVFVAALQACARVGDLKAGQQVHSDLLASEIEPHLVVYNCLIDMYAKCGSLEDAQRVFDGLSDKDVVTWNAIIAGYSQQGKGREALRLYRAMNQGGIAEPDSVTFVCLLRACASVGVPAIEKGQWLHRQIEARGLKADVVVGCSLVNMYAKCGSLEDAQFVFDGLPRKDVVTWNALIAGYSHQGKGQEALRLYSAMQAEGIISPDAATFACLLQACASIGIPAMEKGRKLHRQIEGRGLQGDVVVGCSLVNMYAKCGSLEEARSVFDRLPKKTVVTWNAMIAGYSQHGKGQEALHLYNALKEGGVMCPDAVTFLCLLQACATIGIPALEMGKELHRLIEEQGLRDDVLLANNLINMYGKCGSLKDARKVFDSLPQKDSVSFVFLLQACAILGASALDMGKQLHVQIGEQGLQSDLVVGCSLVNMYTKCGSLQEAQSVFDRLCKKDVVTWTALIAGYCQQGKGEEALRLYSAMQEEGLTSPDSVIFACLLQACASVGNLAMEKGKQLHRQVEERGLEADLTVANSLITMYAKCGSLEHAQSVFDKLPHKASETFVCFLQACASVGNLALENGKQLHAQIVEQGLQDDVVVGCSLVNMYARCGSLLHAQTVFDRLPQKDVVTWTALIAGYSQQGMGQKALHLYTAMQHEGIAAPDSVTFVCLLQACANVAALHMGRRLHAQIEEEGLEADAFVAVTLINMYAKSGSMEGAQLVFDALPKKDIVAWNALITGYTRQGDSEAVFDLFHRLREDGLQPDGITFLNVLTVCSHVGLVNKGREYFEALSRHSAITPTAEHYSCMVDLLGRAGSLDEALEVAQTMPVEPHAVVWRTLLGACRKWSNVEIGRRAFDEAVKLDEKDSAAYVLMSNIYTGAQMWDDADEMHVRRKGMGAWKQPGQSWWTDMDGLAHTFVVGDQQHPESEGIYARLNSLFTELKEAGYVSQLGLVIAG